MVAVTNLTAQKNETATMGHMDKCDLRASMAKLFRHADVQRFKRGSVIIQPGIEPPGVFYIYDGFVKSYSIDSEGRYNLLSIKRKGDVFPFEWALRQHTPALYFEAISDLTVKRLSRDAFRKSIESDPALALATLRLSLTLLGAYGKRIHTLELPTVGQRLAARLLYLAENFGKDSPEGIALELPCNYQDIADAINSTRDTVNREILKFKELGILKIRRRKIRIVSLDALKDYMSSGELPECSDNLERSRINDVHHGGELAADVPL